MFLKRNRTGKIKALGFTDGRPQQEYIGKEETSSHTVSIYALFVSCVTNAIEGKEVVTCNIPGTFLQSWLKDKPTYLKFDGIMMDMLCEIDPSLKKHVIIRGWYNLMYRKLDKAV